MKTCTLVLCSLVMTGCGMQRASPAFPSAESERIFAAALEVIADSAALTDLYVDPRPLDPSSARVDNTSLADLPESIVGEDTIGTPLPDDRRERCRRQSTNPYVLILEIPTATPEGGWRINGHIVGRGTYQVWQAVIDPGAVRARLLEEWWR